ncbi:SDR family oxidoreductase [Dinghuibacter silviterrae]|uniref:Short-subunit dehydrogenase n=1 Tax=Dinghuibacter silviterrae TaxID=1539049 RepID=A0A4R8DH74_9BACT|nr:SDR family oxidoreductase [Dinghuibacter silviterrae]TDW96584.1 short-subunit dehydrogenase [Dinghuibacter silviterrae]
MKKTALITGANKSIGFETARQLAQQGYFVYIGSRDLAKGSAAAAKLHAEGLSSVAALQLDVTDPASIAAARASVSSLDVLINNAGISGGFPQPASTTTSALAREVYNTNVFGAMDMVGAFIDLLHQSPEPRIVNVTSLLGSLTLHSDPRWKFYAIKGGAYGPSKSALNAYTVALAYDLRDTPFKVNAVCPGHTATDFNRHNGPGSVEDAAAIIVKYATIGADGPTGKYFSNDIPDRGESPW